MSPAPTPSTSASSPPSTAGPNESDRPPASGGSWVEAGRLAKARNSTNVVVLGTGEILVVGSDYMTSWRSACGAATDGSDSVEIGDAATAVWKKTASLPNKRETPILIALHGGGALVTGGENGESKGNVAYSSTYVFDAAARSWTRSGLMNTARSDPASALLADGRVLVAGGRYNDKTQDQPLLDSSELWEPTSERWSRTGSLAHPRVGAAAVTLEDGRVLIVGGVSAPENAPDEQASAEVYDPASGRWSSAGTLATARSGFSLVALADGGALVAGGFGTSASGYLSSVERFDPASNTWSAAHDLPVPVAGASGIRLADGRVLLAGGSVRPAEPVGDGDAIVSGLTADATLFDPDEDAWAATTPMPKPRAGASAVLLADGSAVLVGGSASEGPFDTPGCPEADPTVFRYAPGS